MKTVSIIVPVYNTEKYLRRCVDSVISQSYSELDIILVDDGSTDNSAEMCDKYAQEDSRIRVIHKQNAGLGMARNSGLDAANGDYVAFIDSDDWIELDHIENLVREITETEADLAIGTLRESDGEGNEKKRGSYIKKGIYEGIKLKEGLLYPMIGPSPEFGDDVQIESSSCTNLYSMDIIRENGLRYQSEREAVAEDVFFNIAFLGHARRVVVTEESGYLYYYNGASISRKYDKKRFDRTIEFYRRLSNAAEQYGADVMRARRSFLMKIRIAIRLVALSSMKKKEKIAVIGDILKHETVEECISSYPIEKYGTALRLLSRNMRSKRVYSVYYLTLLREYMRGRSAFGAVLKGLGLGYQGSRR